MDRRISPSHYPGYQLVGFNRKKNKKDVILCLTQRQIPPVGIEPTSPH